MIIQFFKDKASAEPRDLAPITVTQTGDKGFQKEEVRRICAEIPTIEGFAASIDTPSSTLRKWAKDHEEFGAAYARAKDIQFQLLVDRGLTRQYDPTAFQFVAKNITDMTDKQVLAGDSEHPLTLELVDAGAGSKEEE